MKAIVIAWFCVLVSVGSARAATYYVDRSCANNGNGLADQCAASAGSAGAFSGNAGPQTCLNTATTPGDTCLIKNGTYITTHNVGSNSGNRNSGGYYFTTNGLAGNPITLKNYPGHSPILAACAYPQISRCAHPTITCNTRNYITIEGLQIEGALFCFKGAGSTGVACAACMVGVVISNNRCAVGWEDLGDGNWSCFRLEGMNGAHVHHNYIHDVAPNADGCNCSSMTGIKMYQAINSIIEYNTIKNVGPTCVNCVFQSQAGGIDDKADAVGSIHRYNRIENVNTAMRIENQSQGTGFPASTGLQIYQNVFVSANHPQSRRCIILLTLIADIDIHNNLCWGWGQSAGDGHFNVQSACTTVCDNIQFYNNIIANVQAVTRNLGIFSSSVTWTRLNYNVYDDADYRWSNGTSYTSLGAYQAANGGLDANSRELDCAFVSSQFTDGDFHLGAGSPCIGIGRVGGTSVGAVIDVGPYANGITCVGHTCGTGTGSQPPSAPTNLRITRGVAF